MCRYCEDSEIIFDTEVVSETSWGWGGPDLKISDEDICYENRCLFIDDRGYLRLVDKEDCGCLDHGEKIKITFCPFCGKEFYKE